MSFTKFSVVTNVVAPAMGIAGGAFVKWADLDWPKFIVFALLMAASLAAGAMALYAETQTKPGVSEEEVTRQRRRIIGRSMAQYLLGMTFVYQTNSPVWMVVLVGLVLGGGPVIMKMLSDLRKVISGDDKPPDGG